MTAIEARALTGEQEFDEVIAMIRKEAEAGSSVLKIPFASEHIKRKLASLGYDVSTFGWEGNLRGYVLIQW
jgi:hypothetical protein